MLEKTYMRVRVGDNIKENMGGGNQRTHTQRDTKNIQNNLSIALEA
jgi:hypothetical protein